MRTPGDCWRRTIVAAPTATAAAATQNPMSTSPAKGVPLQGPEPRSATATTPTTGAAGTTTAAMRHVVDSGSASRGNRRARTTVAYR